MNLKENSVYIYKGSRISVGQNFKMDIENGDAWYELDPIAHKILAGHTIIQIDSYQLQNLVSLSEFQGLMLENSYKKWYNKRLLDNNPTAPETQVENQGERDTLTDLGGLRALGVRIQRH